MSKESAHQIASWKDYPENNEWNTDENWEGSEVPTEVAMFVNSGITCINFSKLSKAVIEKILFKKGAPSYNFTITVNSDTPALTIKGEGIVNESGHIQSFTVASKGKNYWHPQLKFAGKASAGSYNVSYYSGPESLENGFGGGIIGFCDHTTAGAAMFTVRTGAQAPPRENSTVGGEVSFSDFSNAGTSRFFIFGTLGKDGDTFGNTVFHDQASAAHAVFTNMGGTVPKGDGGNTQLYNNATAAFGIFNNYGGVCPEANGGDVAFDGNATGGNGQFYNRVATAKGAFGGVTSFNNNPPFMQGSGAKAGEGYYYNYGASQIEHGGGGHTEFTAKYGSPTAENAHIFNYGSILKDKSTAGHTIFSISPPTEYYPSAGNAVIWNYPGLGKEGAGGFTEFSVYEKGTCLGVPNAGQAVFHNVGASVEGASGGFTSFNGISDAANAKLIAYGGINQGSGGMISFSDKSTGAGASIELMGNGTLDLSKHKGKLTVARMILTGGMLNIQLGRKITSLHIDTELVMNAPGTTFCFVKDEKGGFEYNIKFKILSASNLSEYQASQFTGNRIHGIAPTFSIKGKDLFVAYLK